MPIYPHIGDFPVQYPNFISSLPIYRFGMSILLAGEPATFDRKMLKRCRPALIRRGCNANVNFNWRWRIIKILPTQENFRERGPLRWAAKIGGVVGIVSALAMGANGILGPVMAMDHTVADPRPAPSGRLGLSFVQNGVEVPKHRIRNEFGKSFAYTYEVVLARRRFEMRLPRRYCGGTVDTYSTGVAVRVMPVGATKYLAGREKGADRRNFKSYFPVGHAYAEPLGTLTSLIIYDPPLRDGFIGYNYFADERFWSVTPNEVTIAVRSVVNFVIMQDILSVGTPFLLLVGVKAAQCNPNNAPGIELVHVRFE